MQKMVKNYEKINNKKEKPSFSNIKYEHGHTVLAIFGNYKHALIYICI